MTGITMKSTSISKRGNPARFPLLPLRDIVVFPSMVIPLFVGREKSIQALQAAMDDSKLIFLATQKNARTEEPTADDIYTAGTICQILQLLRLPDGTVKVLVEGKRRGNIVSYETTADYFIVDVEEVAEKRSPKSEVEALVRSVTTTFENYAKLAKSLPTEIVGTLTGNSDPGQLADSLVAHLNLKITDKQELLAMRNVARRLEKLLALMESEIEILQIEKKIRNRVKKQMEKSQREYYLNEQMRAIQKELGAKDEFKQEISELEKKIEKLNLSV